MIEQQTTGSRMTTKQYFTQAGAAAAFAVRAHDGQVRTGTQFPYVVHPLGVGQILRECYPLRDDLEAAGYLHDVIEDTDVTYEDLLDRFGQSVADMVMDVTRRRGWRLEDYASNGDVMRLKGADVLDNMLDTLRGLEKGHDVWIRFNAGKGKIDYWDKVIDMVQARLRHEVATGDKTLLMRLDDALYRIRAWERIRP